MNGLAIAFEEFSIDFSGSPLAKQLTFSAKAPTFSPRECEVIERNAEINSAFAPAFAESREDGIRVSSTAVYNFVHLLRLLPAEFPVTDPYVSHAGSICLDWDQDPNNQFSVMLLDGDRIAFSAYLAGERVNGSADFMGDQLPAQLLLAAGQWTRRALRR